MEGEPERHDGRKGEEKESPEGLREDLNEKYGEHWNSREEGGKAGDGERGHDETGTIQHAEPAVRQSEERRDNAEPTEKDDEAAEPTERAGEGADAHSEAEELREYLKEKYDSEDKAVQGEVPPQERSEDRREAESETDAPQEPAEVQSHEPAETEASGEPGGENDPAKERENDANDVENSEPPDPKEDSADELDGKPAADSKVEREGGEGAHGETPRTTDHLEAEASQPASENRTEPPQDAQDESDEKLGIGREASRETPQSTPEVVAEPDPVEARDQSDPPEPSPEEADRENTSVAQPKEESRLGESVNSFGENEDDQRTNALASEVDRDEVEPSAVSLRSEAESTTVPARTDTFEGGMEMATDIAGVDGRENQPVAESSVNQELSAGDASISHPGANTAGSSGLESSVEPQHEEPQVGRSSAVENPPHRPDEFPASCEPEHVSEGAEHEPIHQPRDRPLGPQREPAEATEQPLAVIPVKAYEYQIPGREHDIRFDIRSDSFQEKTGVKFEEGKVYEIKGKIGDVCEFAKNHVEREGNHVIIMVPKEHRESITARERYEIVITSIEEKRNFSVESNGKRASVNIQPYALESLGLHVRELRKESPIVEFQIRDPNKREATREVFAKLEPHDGSARLGVTSLGLRDKDQLEILRARSYNIRNFIEHFNERKPETLQNVRLGFQGDKLGLQVNGREFPFKEHRLDTHHLQVALKARLDHITRELRFWNDGEKITPRFDDGCKLVSFKPTRDGLKIVYEASQHRMTAVSTGSYSEAIRDVERPKLNMNEMMDKITLLSKPTRVEGEYDVKVDPSLHEYAFSRITEAGNRGLYSQERGTVGEEISTCILLKTGWSKIRKHPDAWNGESPGSNKPGSDYLLRWNPSSESHLFEFKWWKNVEAALGTGRQQVLKSYERRRSVKTNETISGAFLGALDWDLRNLQFRLHLRRVV